MYYTALQCFTHVTQKLMICKNAFFKQLILEVVECVLEVTSHVSFTIQNVVNKNLKFTNVLMCIKIKVHKKIDYIDFTSLWRLNINASINPIYFTISPISIFTIDNEVSNLKLNFYWISKNKYSSSILIHYTSNNSGNNNSVTTIHLGYKSDY